MILYLYIAVIHRRNRLRQSIVNMPFPLVESPLLMQQKTIAAKVQTQVKYKSSDLWASNCWTKPSQDDFFETSLSLELGDFTIQLLVYNQGMNPA